MPMRSFLTSWWFLAISGSTILFCIWRLMQWRESILKKLATEKLNVEKFKNAQLKYLLELEKISNFFSTSVANKNNKEDILWDVAGNLIGKLGFVDCILYLWNSEKTKLIQVAGYGPKGSIEEIKKLHFDVLPGQGIVGHVALTKKAIIVADTSREPRYRVDEMQRQSEICVPILYKDELIGVIDSEHPEKDFFDEGHLQIMTTISTLIANKIKSIESEENLLKKKTELAELNTKLASMEIKALHAQMNPHFIFNSLNSIKEMILNNENKDASRYLSKFAYLIRMSLEESTQTFITLGRNIEYLERYLEIEKSRTNAFTCSIETDALLDVNEVLLPPMLIQPLIENAIWHGKGTCLKTIDIRVRFSKQDNNLVCMIDDTGIGMNASRKNKKQEDIVHHSIGLKNITERIKLLNEKYDLRNKITIEDKSSIPGMNETGTRVTLILSLVTEEL